MIVESSSRPPKIISCPHFGDASPRLKNRVLKRRCWTGLGSWYVDNSVIMQYGRSAPRVAGPVPLSVVIVAASCASGVALILILVGVAGAVRCRRGPGGRRRAASKRLAVDGEVGLDPAGTALVDCSRCRRSKHRRAAAAGAGAGRVITMNGVKEPRRCSNESSSVRASQTVTPVPAAERTVYIATI